ncbi:formate dehydrogenase accessory protein FdhE [Thermomicrobium sp.]
MSAVIEKLEQLAERDAVLAPLARSYAAALRLLSSLSGTAIAVLLDSADRLTSGAVPLLHGRTIAADLGALRQLAGETTALLVRDGIPEASTLYEAVARDRLALLELVQAAVCADQASLERLAAATPAADQLVAVLGSVLAIPVLAGLARNSAPVSPTHWRAGYCPVCAAWPTLAEFRGLERERWLRCGRCGSGWRFPHQECPFCGNSDHRRLGYFAEEGKQDSQRVEICQECRGYVKTFATLGPWSQGEILLHDLTTVELDLVAAERDYRRPGGLGYPLAVQIVARDLAA